MKPRKIKGPMPKVEFDGQVYSLTSRKTIAPDLSQMSHLEAAMWVRDHTRPRGYFKPDNPMTGYGGTVN